MKYVCLLLLVLFTFQGKAQLPERNQRKLDSLYPIALDKSKTIEVRCKAYRGCCFATVHHDYNQGIKYSSEYLALAKAGKLHDHIAKALQYTGYAQTMLGQMDAAK